MRLRRMVALAVAAAMIAMPVAAFATPPPASVSGVVSGPAGPLSGAVVKVEVVSRGLYVPVTTLQTTADGHWSYQGRGGDYRFTFSASGMFDRTETLTMVNKRVYSLDVTLSPSAPPTATISGRITGAGGTGMYGFVYFYRQNADGTWPASYSYDCDTAPDGTYTSPPLPLGTYKVRLFTVHTGVQWYRYAATIETATPIVLDTAGEDVGGVDAQYPPPSQ